MTTPAEGRTAGVAERTSEWLAGEWLARLRPPRLGLRTRVLLMFAFGAFFLSFFLAALALSFTRNSILNQRDRAGTEQAYRDAQVAQLELSAENSTPQSVIDRLQSLGVAPAAINARGTWVRSSARFGPDSIPTALQRRVIEEGTPSRMITTIGGRAVLVIGIPLPSGQDWYFEFVDLSDVDNTLASVRLSLLFGGVITTMAGALTGTFAARRAVRPLGDAAQAAKAIAGGRLDTRLELTDDHDLNVLSRAFNDMAAALQARVERDARFASDVSHELRSPLMTLAASVEVMQARRDELPERAQAALDLLVADVSRFQGLVEDLLEISRFDAGAVRLHLEDFGVAEFVRQAVAVSSVPRAKVDVSDDAERLVLRGDRRRLARVIANLIDNARIHGGGDPQVSVLVADDEGEPVGHVRIAVDDHGPGVPADERDLVFERFARGSSAGRRSASDGAGLGLALVEEHVRIHGGRVWVEDRTDGETGARFVVELPAEEAEA